MDLSSIKTIPDLFYQAAARYSKRDSLSYSDETPFTYRQVYDRVTFLSEKLKNENFGKGSKAAILSENSPLWGMVYFGISSSGGVMVPILPDFNKADVENILSHAEVTHIFTSRKQRDKLIDVESRYQINTIEDLFNDVPASLDDSPLPDMSHPETKAEELACLIYTSGTTGSSKGVMLSHENIIQNVLHCKHIPPLRNYDRALSVLPLAHTYECTLGLLVPVLRGATIFYLKKPPSTSVLLPALKKVRPGMILSVPLLMEKIYNGIKSSKVDKSKLLSGMYKHPFTRLLANRLIGISLRKTFGGRLRFFGIGGAPLSEEAEKFLLQAKFPYAIGYGLTETSPLLAGDNARNTKYRSTGRFLSNIEHKLDTSKGKEGNGEILVKGPSIMMGYYKEPEKTAEVLSEDGWFRTGDLGAVENGYLTIKGRVKNMILGANGENIYPENIENLINMQDFVEESVVFHDEETKTLVARIHINYDNFNEHVKNLRKNADVLQEDITQYLQDVKDSINKQMSKFSKIHEVVEQKEPFIKTPTLKIKRFLYSKKKRG
ncbi:MAG: AMP-binding protein [Spirochaetales bacterium]|nr:AMP-binding protein [Spirochaetales bacterium]